MPDTLPLSSRTLQRHAARAAIPTYDRSALTPGVAHISVGSFHRAHQAVYFDDLAQRGISSEWGILGIGLNRPHMRDALVPQDGLYTLVERGSRVDHARIVGSIVRYRFAPQDDAGVADALAAPHTRLLTLTITASAYGVDPATGRFAPSPEAIRDVLGRRPRTALGLVVEALDRRRRTSGRPFTVLSCDNEPDNGAMTRTAVLGLAELRDPRLARWITEHVTFPSSMVDRITPQTTAADRRLVRERFGIEDRWPVMTEPFSQWVVEDAFCDGRPPLDEVGAQMVSDVRPYAVAKTRLLNGGHCALAYLGLLAGLERVDEAMADPAIGAAVGEMLREEVAPILPPVPALDLGAYVDAVVARCANPRMGDRLDRLARNGSAKVPRHVLSSLREARAGGRPHRVLTLAVAAWLRFLRGVDDHGRPLGLDDPLAVRLSSLAMAAEDVRLLLRERDLFGDVLDDAGLVAELQDAADLIARDGAAAACATVLAEAPGIAA